jgi:hypothetical protein
METSQNSSNETSAGEHADEPRTNSLPGGGGRLPGAWSMPARGGRLVALRGGRERGPERTLLDRGTLRLDLQAPIDMLRALKSDLEVYYWERSDGERQDSERYQISLWMRYLTERTAALEGIVMHMGCPMVTLTGVGPPERDALRNAASELDRWIHGEEAFHDVLRHLTAILSAADTMALRAAAGIPRSAAWARPRPSGACPGTRG